MCAEDLSDCAVRSESIALFVRSARGSAGARGPPTCTRCVQHRASACGVLLCSLTLSMPNQYAIVPRSSNRVSSIGRRVSEYARSWGLSVCRVLMFDFFCGRYKGFSARLESYGSASHGSSSRQPSQHGSARLELRAPFPLGGWRAAAGRFTAQLHTRWAMFSAHASPLQRTRQRRDTTL